MVTIEGAPGAGDPSVLARWARLPLQGVLISGRTGTQTDWTPVR